MPTPRKQVRAVASARCVVRLACHQLLLINIYMTSDDIIDTLGLSETAGSAPMTRALSILLIVGQIVMAVGLVLMLVMALIMANPSTLRDSLLAEAATPPDPSIFLGRCLAGAVLAVGWFFVLKLLRKVVSAVIHGDPFLPENVARLRNIWVIIAATEFFRTFTNYFMGANGDIDGSRLDIRIGTWFFIFIIAAISEAFRHGAALRAEQELTI